MASAMPMPEPRRQSQTDQRSSAFAVRIALSGPGITDRYSLGEVARILGDVDCLYRSAFESLAGVDIEDYELEVSAAFPQSGSYIIELLLWFKSVSVVGAPLLPMLAHIAPKDVFATAKSALELWTSLFKKHDEKADPPTLNIVQNKGVVIVNTSAGPMEFELAALRTAAKSQDELRHLDHTPLAGEITAIEMSSEAGSMQWDEKQSSAVQSSSRLDLRGELNRIDPAPHRARPSTVRGNIIGFDKVRRGGVVRVSNGQTLAPGDYPFNVAGDQLLRPYIEAMTAEEVELEYRPLYGARRKINSLDVLGVKGGPAGLAA